MLLQGTQDESDDVTPIRSDAEEEGFLEELVIFVFSLQSKPLAHKINKTVLNQNKIN